MALEGNTVRHLKAALGNNAAASEVQTALEIVDGVLATATEITNLCDNIPYSATLTPAAGASNVCEVTIQVLNAAGTAVAYPVILDVLLSDAATGTGLTATTASGAVAAKASSGTDLAVLVAKKATKVQTLADGTYILSITDTAKTGFYVVAAIPGVPHSVSSVLVTGNYG